MGIIYNEKAKTFTLHTQNTTYQMQIDAYGFLLHLYYGRKIHVCEPLDENAVAPLIEKHTFQPGNSCVYDREHDAYTLEDLCLEMSAYGKGDIREPFVELIYEDGSFSSDFVYESSVRFEGREARDAEDALPASYDEKNQVEHLCVTLKDNNSALKLELHYYIYEDCDVITRSAKLINDGENAVQIRRLMSCQVDFPTSDHVFTSFHGAWAREMRRWDVPVAAGKYVNASYTGTSSSRTNPFVMLSGRETTEDTGDCYGFNLVYSGNHYEAVEVNSYGKTRFVSGINPQNFCWQLPAGESFEAPEAVMAYSKAGYNGMSQCMHRFVREHIVRGAWKKKVRPVLLNSWEAAYFDINEKKLLQLAKAGKEAGIELFVMDDGWFGHRDNDRSSLGDWKVNTKKLPNGLAGLCKKINDLGMDFGIWVEPEMISENSNLYKEHHDWAMKIPGHPHSEGRNQCILDLCNPEVRKYVIEEMTRVFSSGDIRYAKWDMNRIFSDIYAPSLPAERQGETAHRYVLGLYHIMEELTTRFPKILFEGCSAGGNRFDLGILCYFPQIWASDNTDALCRTEIQNSYSYGYPLSVFTAHVSSCPNHQTLRITPLETRFQVASFGVLGYECNLKDLSGSDLNAIREQIALYKKWREVFQFGTFYRGTENEDSDSETLSWTCVSPDGRRAVGLFFRRLTTPNQSHDWYRPVGLLPDVKYHFYGRNIKYNLKDFGDLVNTVSPVHIKQGSALQEILSRFVNMDGEKEDLTAYGDTLMLAGIALKPAFAGTGYNSDTRLFPDFSSRIYFMEAVE